MTDIQKAFDETLQGSQLPDAGVDIVEASIDSLIDNDVLKEIPIVKTFVGLAQVGANINDKLFLKKILSFLKGISDTDEDERTKMIEEIDSSEKHRIKVGEKLLYLLDNCRDYESAEILAKLFSAFLAKEISYDDYRIAAEVVSEVAAEDISWFIEEYAEHLNVDDIYVPIYTGLFMLSSDVVQVSVRENDDYKAIRGGASAYVAEADGGGVWASPSRAGKVIYKVLGPKESEK